MPHHNRGWGRRVGPKRLSEIWIGRSRDQKAKQCEWPRWSRLVCCSCPLFTMRFLRRCLLLLMECMPLSYLLAPVGPFDGNNLECWPIPTFPMNVHFARKRTFMTVHKDPPRAQLKPQDCDCVYEVLAKSCSEGGLALGLRLHENQRQPTRRTSGVCISRG